MRPLTKKELEITMQMLSDEIVKQKDITSPWSRQLITRCQKFRECYKVRYGDVDEKDKGVLPKLPNGQV